MSFNINQMFSSLKYILLLSIALSVLSPSDARLNQLLSQKHGKLGLPFGISNISLPPDEWFVQKLDHFDFTDTRTWRQRFFTNSTWYVPGGPVFLMIGGEGTASPKWMVQGAWLDYAKKYQALCFQVEHRFYGESQPFGNLSVENLYYLNSEQALADLAYFITSINNKFNIPRGTKWFAFGGSYPGSLAAWLRYKYPHLVHGAVSSSGPLKAVIDFPEYFQVVTDALGTISNKCVAAVHSATQTISQMLKSPPKARYLSEIFKLCKPLNVSNSKDVSSFVESLADNFAGVVQYNRDNRDGSKNVTIETLCDIMQDEKLKPIQRYAVVNFLSLKSSNQTCLDYEYDKMISEMKNTSLKSSMADGARQWVYQTCTEFGFYQTSNQSSHIFGKEFSKGFFEDQCKDIYGPIFTRDFLENSILRTNMMYGALNLEVSRVVFIHGSIDPWHALGIYQTRSENAPAIYIKGTAHCANMYPPSDDDLPDLKNARKQIETFIGEWLKQKYHKEEETAALSESYYDHPEVVEDITIIQQEFPHGSSKNFKTNNSQFFNSYIKNSKYKNYFNKDLNDNINKNDKRQIKNNDQSIDSGIIDSDVSQMYENSALKKMFAVKDNDSKEKNNNLSSLSRVRNFLEKIRNYGLDFNNIHKNNSNIEENSEGVIENNYTMCEYFEYYEDVGGDKVIDLGMPNIGFGENNMIDDQNEIPQDVIMGDHEILSDDIIGKIGMADGLTGGNKMSDGISGEKKKKMSDGIYGENKMSDYIKLGDSDIKNSNINIKGKVWDFVLVDDDRKKEQQVTLVL